MVKRWYWLFILIVAFGCVEIDVKKGEHLLFTINEGQHYSVKGIQKFSGNSLNFAVKFDSSCIYDLGNINQHDINKLIGFKFGLDVHKNSARIGWRYNVDNEVIEIFAYSYVEGVRDSRKLGVCFIDEVVSINIEVGNGLIFYEYMGFTYVVEGLEMSKEKYFSFPYFGGNEVAPHMMQIEIWF